MKLLVGLTIVGFQRSTLPQSYFNHLFSKRVSESCELKYRYAAFFSPHTIELKEMEERLLDIAYHSVRQRVANALLKFTYPDLVNETVVVNMTRRDLAEVVGTASESVNRTLSDFKEEGL